MKQAVVLMVVALVATGSAKPVESNRKPSAVNQYPFYGPNFLYGTDRISDEFLKRLFAKRLEDSSVDAPFVHVPDVPANGDRLGDADERLWQLLQPQEKPLEDKAPKPIEELASDAEHQEPLREEKYPGVPEVPKEIPGEAEERVNNEKVIEKEQEKPEKPDQQPKEDGKGKEKQQPKPDQQPEEDDKEKQQQKPARQPKGDEKRKGKEQDGAVPKPNPNESNKHESEKRGRPGQPNKGNRPGGRKPSEDLARRPGKDDARGDRDKPESPSGPQPELPPRRQPQSPLVQINVNVASPVL